MKAQSPTGVTEEFPTVQAYEQSWMWKATKRRYAQKPRACFICEKDETVLHHRTYIHIGNERWDELVPLCDSHHYLVERLIRGGWASRWDAHLLLRDRLAKREGDLRSMSGVLERSPVLKRLGMAA